MVIAGGSRAELNTARQQESSKHMQFAELKNRIMIHDIQNHANQAHYIPLGTRYLLTDLH